MGRLCSRAAGASRSMDAKNAFKRVFSSGWFMLCVVVIALYCLLGFFLLPYTARHYLKEYVETRLKRRLAVE
jgi:hypothetical protein